MADLPAEQRQAMEVAVVPLERGISGFAVTAASKRVDAPTSQPVMIAILGG